MRRGTSKLTKEQIDKVIVLKQSGMQNNQIAKQFGVPHWIIGYVLRKNNLKSFYILDNNEIIKIIELHREGKNNTEISKVIGVTDAAIGCVLKRHNLETNLRRVSDMGDEIIRLYQEGLSSLAISKKVGFSDSNIGIFLKRRGLFPQRYRSLELVNENHARCSKCHEIKEILNWPQTRKSYYSYCTDCLYKRLSATAEKNRNPFRVKCSHLRKRCRESSLSFQITPEYLEKLWEQQHGLCFYSDLPMILNTRENRAPEAMSVDRIIPQEGYVEGNIVLCRNRINTMKSNATLDEMKVWMPDWYARIMNHQLYGYGIFQVIHRE